MRSLFGPAPLAALLSLAPPGMLSALSSASAALIDLLPSALEMELCGSCALWCAFLGLNRVSQGKGLPSPWPVMPGGAGRAQRQGCLFSELLWNYPCAKPLRREMFRSCSCLQRDLLSFFLSRRNLLCSG